MSTFRRDGALWCLSSYLVCSRSFLAWTIVAAFLRPKLRRTNVDVGWSHDRLEGSGLLHNRRPRWLRRSAIDLVFGAELRMEYQDDPKNERTHLLPLSVSPERAARVATRRTVRLRPIEAGRLETPSIHVLPG